MVRGVVGELTSVLCCFPRLLLQVIMWELFHGMSAWNHLVRLVGMPQKRGFPTFLPGMFNFDKCTLPAYAKLGQACLSLNPVERPSFTEVLQTLHTMLADCVHERPHCEDVPAAAGDHGAAQQSSSSSNQPCAVECGADVAQCHLQAIEVAVQPLVVLEVGNCERSLSGAQDTG